MAFDDTLTVQQLQDHEEEIRLCMNDIAEGLNAGDIETAKIAYNKAKELTPNAAVMSFLEGEIAFAEMKLDDARKAYEAAFEAGYFTDKLTLHLGVVYYLMGKLNAAVEMLSRSEALNEKLSRPTELKAEIFFDNGNYDRCKIAARRIKSNFPDNAYGYHYEYLCYLKNNELGYAATAISEAIEKFPDNTMIRLDLINYYNHIRQFQDAYNYLNMYEESDAEFAGDIHVIRLKCDILYKLGRYDEVDKCCTDLLTKEYSDDMAFILMISLIYIGNYHKALQCAKLIKDNRDDATEPIYYYAALYYEAWLYKETGDIDRSNELLLESEDIYTKKCIEYPLGVRLHMYRVLSYMLMENYEKALDKALYMETITDGGYGDLYYLISNIYEQMGDADKAEEYMAKFEKTGAILSAEIIL